MRQRWRRLYFDGVVFQRAKGQRAGGGGRALRREIETINRPYCVKESGTGMAEHLNFVMRTICFALILKEFYSY